MKILLKLMKLRFWLLSVIAPKTAAQKALNIFTKPHFKKTRDREKRFLNTANVLRIKHEIEDIIIYESGEKSGIPIVAVHGWDSNPGSLSGITDELAKRGFHIYSLNVPAHGISKKKGTNMFETAQIIVKILKYINHEKVSFVTHSFGSGAVSIALQTSKIKADKLAFITSPDKLWDIFKDFADMIGLNNKAFKTMLKITEKRFGRTFDEMQISNILSESYYNKILIIHDKKDKILPFENSNRIQNLNPKSEIFATEGKGHYRILWDEQVIKKVTQFMEG